MEGDVSVHLHELLSDTLARIRGELLKRSRSRSIALDEPGGSTEFPCKLSLRRMLVLSQRREAHLQDEIDHMKVELESRNAEIARLNTQLEESEVKVPVLDEPPRSRCETVEFASWRMSEMNSRSDSRNSVDSIKSSSTTKTTYKRSHVLSHKTRPDSFRPFQRLYRPTTCPVQLSSSYIPDISRHFRTAPVVTDSLLPGIFLKH